MSKSSANKLEIVREALRHTELHLKGLEDLATVADRRSTGFFAGGIGFAGFLLALADKLSFDAVTYVAAFLSVVSAIISVWSILPRRFHILGHRWMDWKGHFEEGDELIDVLVSQAEENDERIQHNFAVLEKSAWLMKVAVKLLIFAALIVVASQLWVAFEQVIEIYTSTNDGKN